MSSINAKSWELFQVKNINTKNGEAKILSPTRGTQVVVLPEGADTAALLSTVNQLGGKVVKLEGSALFINEIQESVSKGLDSGKLPRDKADQILANAERFGISHSVRGQLV